MRRSVLVGTGSALPERAVSNAELAKQLDTSDEWIVERTGITNRYITGEGETDAGIDDSDVDAPAVQTVPKYRRNEARDAILVGGNAPIRRSSHAIPASRLRVRLIPTVEALAVPGTESVQDGGTCNFLYVFEQDREQLCPMAVRIDDRVIQLGPDLGAPARHSVHSLARVQELRTRGRRRGLAPRAAFLEV